MSNPCPSCQQEAMSATDKLAKRPFVCRHCGQALRLNPVYSLLLSVVYLAAVVWIFMNQGASVAGLLQLLVATAVFVGVCLMVPLEAKADRAES